MRSYYYLGGKLNRLDFGGSSFDPNKLTIVDGKVTIKPEGITNADINANAAIDRTKIAGVSGAIENNLATFSATGDVKDSAFRLANVSSRSYLQYTGTATSFGAAIMELDWALSVYTPAIQAQFTDLPAGINPSLTTFVEMRGKNDAAAYCEAWNNHQHYTFAVSTTGIITGWRRIDNLEVLVANNPKRNDYTTVIELVQDNLDGNWGVDSTWSPNLTDRPDGNAPYRITFKCERLVVASAAIIVTCTVQAAADYSRWQATINIQSGTYTEPWKKLLTDKEMANQTPRTATILSANTNFDTLKQPGYYYSNDANMPSYANLPSDLPVNVGFVLEIFVVHGTAANDAPGLRIMQRLTQRVYPGGQNELLPVSSWVRFYSNETNTTPTWTGWRRFSSNEFANQMFILPTPAAGASLAAQLLTVPLGKYSVPNTNFNLYTDLPTNIGAGAYLNIETMQISPGTPGTRQVKAWQADGQYSWWNLVVLTTGVFQIPNWVLVNLPIYSTTERIAGTWIDGSRIYQRTLIFPNFTVSTSEVNQWKILATWASLGSITNLIKAECMAPFLSLGATIGNVESNLCIAMPQQLNIARTLYVTLWYTK